MRWLFSRDVKRTESYSRIVRHTSASGSRLEARGMKDVAEENRTPYCVGITNGAHVARPRGICAAMTSTYASSLPLIRTRESSCASGSFEPSQGITIVISAAETDLEEL